ncbi:MAG: hypothetical protein U0527_10870 [Candidatus Eisenbacteria bacterium]
MFEYATSTSRPSGFRDDEKRRRRLLRGGLVVAWVFGVLMTQVWVSTEVKERRARCSQLDVEIGRLEVDLSALQGRLQSQQTFSELLSASNELGLCSDGVRQRVALPGSQLEPTPTAPIVPAQASILPNFRALRRPTPSQTQSHGKGH